MKLLDIVRLAQGLQRTKIWCRIGLPFGVEEREAMKKVIRKRQFSFNEETARLWARLWPTQGASTESGALAQFLYLWDENLRAQLDRTALQKYERGELDRSELIRAVGRYKLRHPPP